MALGKTHDVINLIALPALFYYLPKEFYLPFGVGYIVGTFLLSPDIDLPNSRPSRRWSLLKCLWLPYQNLSRHRGFSHIPIVGSLLRLIYIVSVVIFLYFVLIGILSFLDRSLSYLIASFNPFEFLSELFRSEGSLYFVAGIICADVVHIVLDWVTSLLRRVT